MKAKRLQLAVAVSAALITGNALAKDTSGHDVGGSVELEFRTNDNINVAPASTDSFDFADFSDFEEAEAKLGDDDGEDDGDGDGSDDGGDDDFGDDDFDFAALDETDFSEDEYDLATDDDDGDGDEDDEDDDGDDDDGGDGGGENDKSLDDLINASVLDKTSTTRTSANRWSSKLALTHKYKFEGGIVTWGSSFRGVSDFNNGRSNLDKQNYAVSTGPEFNLKDMGLKVKPAISYVSIRQDGSETVGTFVATLAASKEFTKKFSMDAIYNWQDQDITSPSAPDALISAFTIGAQFTASKKDIFKAKYQPKGENSTLAAKDKDTDGWQLTYSRKLPWEMILGLGIKDDFVDFKNLSTQREDDVRAYSLDLAKQFSKSFEMGLAYERRKLDSTVDNKDAENRSWLISGTWKF